MNIFAPIELSRSAPALNSSRPATTVLVNTPDVRVLVFRFLPGQTVPLHRNSSSVLLTVLQGSGFVSGESDGATDERPCSTGDLIAYEPDEGHSMRAGAEEMVLLATITPRPGERNASR